MATQIDYRFPTSLDDETSNPNQGDPALQQNVAPRDVAKRIDYRFPTTLETSSGWDIEEPKQAGIWAHTVKGVKDMLDI